MAFLVGIDEAGFGPILGPLVVSSSTFSLPHRLIRADLWQILRKSVGDRRRRLAGRLLIADSKKAYRGPRPQKRAGGTQRPAEKPGKSVAIKHLERTVLACLRCLHKEPATLTELLMMLCPDFIERLGTYPWYEEAGSYDILAGEADMTIASTVLKSNLASNGIELLDLHSCCLDVAYYNKMVGSVKNKANVLFTATSTLIKRAYDSFAGTEPADNELQIVVDRQGGRVRYRNSLQRMFPDMELKILCESPAASSYDLQAAGKEMRLHFVVGADERFLPVSLASMVSKYLRELLVEKINRYFVGFHADLRPTAGYWKDGLRFIQELKTNIPHLKFDSNQLIRCR